MRPGSLIVGLSLAALALAGTGCQNDKLCGAGTVEMNDTCVPTGEACGDGTTYNEVTGKCDGAACATGTVLVDGECVPDGSVVCGDGTVYDPDSGECMPDQTCGEGTVLVDGECIPYDDAVTADVNEGAEPNGFDDDGAGQFTVPEVGENLTIKGCVNPYEGDGNTCGGGNLLPDYDAYYFVASGPTLLEISVDGLNGLSGGFAVLSSDTQLDADGWARFGVNPADDIATRQVFLPKAGTYALGVTDGRSVLLGDAFGGADSCYLATVRHLAMPVPTVMAGTTATGDLGDVKFYRYDDVDEGDLLFPTLGAPSSAAQGMLVSMVSNAYRNSGTGEETLAEGPGIITAGMHAGDTVVFAVDHLYDYSLSPVPYTLRVDDHSAQQLPADGVVSVLTAGGDAFRPGWLYFDVDEAGDVWRQRLLSDDDFNALMIDPWRGTLLGELDMQTDESSTWADEWSRLPRADRFYLAVLSEPDVAIDVASTTSVHTPGLMTIGQDLDDQTLSNDSSNWYTLDVAGTDWLRFTHYQEDFAGSMEVAAYEGDRFGVLTAGTELDSYTFFDTDDEFGRITRGAEITSFLVRVTDTGGSMGTAFDVYPYERAFVDVTIDESTPYTATDVSLDNGPVYYLVTAPERDYWIDTFASPSEDEDLGIVALDDQEYDFDGIDESGSGSSEFLEVETGRRERVALVIYEAFGESGAYGVDIDAYVPTYSVAPGTLPFVDICDCGINAVPLWDPVWGAFPDDDEGASDPITLDGEFAFWGDPTIDVVVTANGLADFAPDLALPFYTDLYRTTACMKQDVDKVTFQWTGELCNWDGDTCLGGPPAQFQLVLHDDDTLDFIYGPDQDLSSSGAFILIEDDFGDDDRIIGDGLRGFALPDTSYTFTYNAPPSK